RLSAAFGEEPGSAGRNTKLSPNEFKNSALRDYILSRKSAGDRELVHMCWWIVCDERWCSILPFTLNERVCAPTIARQQGRMCIFVLCKADHRASATTRSQVSTFHRFWRLTKAHAWLSHCPTVQLEAAAA